MAPGWQNKENRARCHIYHLLFLKKKKILCRRTHSFASDTASLMTFTILLPAPEKHYRVEGGLCDPRHTVVHRVIRPRPFGCFLATRRFSFSVSKSCTCTHCWRVYRARVTAYLFRYSQTLFGCYVVHLLSKTKMSPHFSLKLFRTKKQRFLTWKIIVYDIHIKDVIVFFLLFNSHTHTHTQEMREGGAKSSKKLDHFFFFLNISQLQAQNWLILQRDRGRGGKWK